MVYTKLVPKQLGTVDLLGNSTDSETLDDAKMPRRTEWESFTAGVEKGLKSATLVNENFTEVDSSHDGFLSNKEISAALTNDEIAPSVKNAFKALQEIRHSVKGLNPHDNDNPSVIGKLLNLEKNISREDAKLLKEGTEAVFAKMEDLKNREDRVALLKNYLDNSRIRNKGTVSEAGALAIPLGYETAVAEAKARSK